jgi:hypothetical protein
MLVSCSQEVLEHHLSRRPCGSTYHVTQCPHEFVLLLRCDAYDDVLSAAFRDDARCEHAEEVYRDVRASCFA